MFWKHMLIAMFNVQYLHANIFIVTLMLFARSPFSFQLYIFHQKGAEPKLYHSCRFQKVLFWLKILVWWKPLIRCSAKRFMYGMISWYLPNRHPKALSWRWNIACFMFSACLIHTELAYVPSNVSFRTILWRDSAICQWSTWSVLCHMLY